MWVQAVFGLDQQAVALALAAFGGGSMAAALALPGLLERLPDRTAMLTGAGLLAAFTLAASAIPSYLALLPIWLVLGENQHPGNDFVTGHQNLGDLDALAEEQRLRLNATLA